MNSLTEGFNWITDVDTEGIHRVDLYLTQTVHIVVPESYCVDIEGICGGQTV